ncbi:thiol-disulfide oxidoreductase [Pseudoruegeria sp. HB172150]|uniref:thiol-disulfide oxidoreductase n=1 Tax=Pseudoruegeria sp. HB172150 TaxID=2721164 RepID=UPI001554CA6A|nr:thiol-disulfide oxidoreductase [Pseudoruegeria sp. HB172150]
MAETTSLSYQERRSALAAQPMDRLGLVTLLSGVYFLQIWTTYFFQDNSIWSSSLLAAMIAVSLVQCLLPRAVSLMGVNAAVFVLHFLAMSPVASNNQTTAFFFSLAIVAGGLLAFRRGDDREGVFRSIAGPGRWLLAIMYFYGIYHKINVDFLDPSVSCATVLYARLADVFGLENWRLGQYGAIYATFVIEGIAMVLLFSTRWKLVGMAIGIPFHVIIGWTGYAYYKDFSTVVLALYALFLPAAALRIGLDKMSAMMGGQAAALRAGRMALFGLAVSYVVLSMVKFGSLAITHESFTWVFTAYALNFYAFVLTCVRPAPGEQKPHAGWLAIIPILFFVNGLSPYLGLKTEGSIAMFSNLHTEGGETNHLITGVLPFGAGYQNDLVVPLGSNEPSFDAAYVGEGLALVRYSFDRILALNPGLVVEVAGPDGPVSTADGWENTYLAAGPLAHRFLLFKPVDFNRPKVCTH